MRFPLIPSDLCRPCFLIRSQRYHPEFPPPKNRPSSCPSSFGIPSFSRSRAFSSPTFRGSFGALCNYLGHFASLFLPIQLRYLHLPLPVGFSSHEERVGLLHFPPCVFQRNRPLGPSCYSSSRAGAVGYLNKQLLFFRLLSLGSPPLAYARSAVPSITG